MSTKLNYRYAFRVLPCVNACVLVCASTGFGTYVSTQSQTMQYMGQPTMEHDSSRKTCSRKPRGYFFLSSTRDIRCLKPSNSVEAHHYWKLIYGITVSTPSTPLPYSVMRKLLHSSFNLHSVSAFSSRRWSKSRFGQQGGELHEIQDFTLPAVVTYELIALRASNTLILCQDP